MRKPTIYDKLGRVEPSQMWAVAQRRFGDAEALVATGDNARANGAQYLAGLVLDILLKAQLLQTYPQARRPASETDSKVTRRARTLIWQSHELDEMLDLLPNLESAIVERGRRAGVDYLRMLRAICAVWKPFVRYSTRTSDITAAATMVEEVRQLKEMLK